MGHLGVVLYEYLGEEYPEVLGSILGALKAIVNVIGMSLFKSLSDAEGDVLVLRVQICRLVCPVWVASFLAVGDKFYTLVRTALSLVSFFSTFRSSLAWPN